MIVLKCCSFNRRLEQGSVVCLSERLTSEASLHKYERTAALEEQTGKEEERWDANKKTEQATDFHADAVLILFELMSEDDMEEMTDRRMTTLQM